MPEAVSRQVELGTFMDGAAGLLFAEAFQRVLENIEDPATDVKATRRITLVISVKPNEKRTDAAIMVDCKTKLSPAKPMGTVVLLGRKDGQPAAVEVFQQERLFGEKFGRPEGVVVGTGTAGGSV